MNKDIKYESLNGVERDKLNNEVDNINTIIKAFYRDLIITYLQLRKYLKHRTPYKSVYNFIRAILHYEYDIVVSNVELHLVSRLYKNLTD